MKESRFIEQNKKKWKELETQLEKDNPKKLSELFIQITDDLSFSRTFYKNRSVRAYLNDVAQTLFQKIYKGGDNKKGQFIQFWKKDLPLVLFNCKYELLVSFMVFVVAALIGIYSTAKDPNFAADILGSDYVTMTTENIEKGDPMAVYKSHGAFDSFLGITFNNIFVAFRTFISGVLLAIGSLFILIYNGVMVGTFQYFFIERGLFSESALTIWQHGTIEILSIIIAGGAGITMGKGILFPGTLTRYQSFRLSAQRGLKIMIGLIPLFVLAGFIEGFLTRYTELPTWVRVLSILVSLSLMVFYFVVYPKMVANNVENPYSIDEIPAFKEPTYLQFEKAQSIGEVLSLTFQTLQRNFGPIFIPLTILIMGSSALQASSYFRTDLVLEKFVFPVAFNSIFLISFVFKTFFIFSLIYLSNKATLKEKHLNQSEKNSKRPIYTALFTLASSLFLAMILQASNENYFWLALILFFPVVSVVNYQNAFEISSNLTSTAGLKWIIKLFSRYAGINLIILFLGMLLFTVIKSPLAGELINQFILTLIQSSDSSEFSIYFTEIVIEFWLFSLCLVLLNISMNTLFYSLKEKFTREILLSRIDKIGLQSNILGIEKED